jgi:hypothetical protein
MAVAALFIDAAAHTRYISQKQAQLGAFIELYII